MISDTDFGALDSSADRHVMARFDVATEMMQRMHGDSGALSVIAHGEMVGELNEIKEEIVRRMVSLANRLSDRTCETGGVAHEWRQLTIPLTTNVVSEADMLFYCIHCRNVTS